MRTTSLNLTKNRALFGANTATLLALCALTLSVSAGCGDAEAYEAIGSAEAGIVDGRPASSGETYSTVALIDIEYGPFCTGTLVTPNVVLTAAHCVQSELS
jgi:V8-like Glu-specific endopeptidase